MRILFCIEDLQVNGAVKSLIALLSALTSRTQHEVSLFLFSHGGELTGELPAPVNLLPELLPYAVCRLPLKAGVIRALKRGRLDLALWRVLIGICRRWSLPFPGWLFLPQLKGPWDCVIGYSDGFVAQMITRRVTRGKHIFWIHNDYRYFRMAEATYRAFSRAAMAVAVSQASGALFVEMMARRRLRLPPVTTVHNIIRVSLSERSGVMSSHASDCGTLVSVGRITRQKGFDLIPSILQILAKRGHRVRWTIVGGGNDWEREAIQHDADGRGVGALLHWTGTLKNPMELVAVADVVVQPSRWEGWGMTVTEAMALHKPIVATDIAVFREQIRHGENGLLAEFTARDFADKIEQLLGDATLRRRIAAACNVDICSPEHVVGEFEAMLKCVGAEA